MNQELLVKILDSDLSRSVKEEILKYWLLPKEGSPNITPIQRTEVRGGAVRRPTKEEIDLRKNPKMAEEKKEMEDTLEPIINKNET